MSFSSFLGMPGIHIFAFLSPTVYLAVGVIIVLALGAFVYFRSRRPSSDSNVGVVETGRAGSNSFSSSPSNNRESFSKSVGKTPTARDLAKPSSNNFSKFSTNYGQTIEIDQLPIGRIASITPPHAIDELEDSNDDGLLAAIDEIQDDSDADSEFRLIALRVLAGFKNRNSVEALSQIALYDLSSNLRSKAVMMLADFDHESVFEPIVLACADPSREVRAAGARALVKVSFDRADAWTRFALSDDQYLSTQIARAAVEAGIVERSFDRLVLQDEKAVAEAFALVYLLIKTGETDKIFEAIRDHRDLKTRVALLHAMRVANVAEVIPHLTAFIAAEPMGSVVADKARETLLGINAMPVTV